MNSPLLRIVCSSLSFACFACTAQKVTANAEQPYVRPHRAMIRLVTTPPTGSLFCFLRSACRTLVVVTAAINRGLNFLLSQDLQGFFLWGCRVSNHLCKAKIFIADRQQVSSGRLMNNLAANLVYLHLCHTFSYSKSPQGGARNKRMVDRRPGLQPGGQTTVTASH